MLNRLTDANHGEGFAVIFQNAKRVPPVAIPEASLDAIVSALIENSRQAGASRIGFTIERTGDVIRLIAADDGPGIPKPDRERIFEPFFTTRRATGGSGLGLPIIKSLVEATGGTLCLDDTERGARFVIELPLAE